MSLLCLHSVFSSPATTLHSHSLVQTRPYTPRFVVLSTHSNAKILKTNRKSRYGQTLSLYDDDSEEEGEDDDDDDDDDEGKEDDWLADDDVSSYPPKKNNISFFFPPFCCG